jgi:hypothetical protein
LRIFKNFSVIFPYLLQFTYFSPNPQIPTYISHNFSAKMLHGCPKSMFTLTVLLLTCVQSILAQKGGGNGGGSGGGGVLAGGTTTEEPTTTEETTTTTTTVA